MTHVEHLLKIIAEGEILRDQMRREMEVMAELIQRQNATAKAQGAAIVKAERLKNAYKARMDVRDKNAGKMKRMLKSAQQQIAQQKEYKAKTKEYIMSLNGGQWPDCLK